MYGLYHLLQNFCTRHPDVLRRAQVLIDLDNQSVVGAFKLRRDKNRETHALMMQQFELQVEYGSMLSLKGVSAAANEVASVISRPSREAIIRIAPASFKAVWDEIGPFNGNRMTCTASVLRSPLIREALPFSLKTTVPVRRGPTYWRTTFDRSGYQSPDLRVLLPTPNHGRTYCTI